MRCRFARGSAAWRNAWTRRLTHFYQDSKKHVRDLLARIPVLGGMATSAIEQVKDGMKAFLTGGMLFEELGFRYIGPIDGHDLPGLRRWLRNF